MHVRMVAIFTLLLAGPVSFAETNAAPTWQEALSGLGIQLDDEAATRASILAAVQTSDRAARLITEQDWHVLQSQQSGRYFDAGVRFVMTNGLPHIVSSVATNLLPGDIIIGAGTNRFTTLSRPEARALLRAGEPAVFQLTIVRDNQTNLIEIALEATQLPAVDHAEMLAGDIAYLGVNGLFPESGPVLAEALLSLEKQQPAGFILDLRDAGGADAEAVAGVASLFSPSGQFLFALRNLHNEELARYSSRDLAQLHRPVIVLIDQQTRGAAEMLAAILADVFPGALLLGAPTAGDFSLREPVAVDDYTIYVSTRVLDTAGGHRYDGRAGLEPSIALDPAGQKTYDYDPPEKKNDRRQTLEIERIHQALRQRTRGDAALERAHDILTALKTLNGNRPAVSFPSP